MDDLPNRYAVFAAMLGVKASVLHAISAPWAGNPCPPAFTLPEFAPRLDEAQRSPATEQHERVGTGIHGRIQSRGDPAYAADRRGGPVGKS